MSRDKPTKPDCRFNSATGFTIFGKAPVILDRRITGQGDSSLTNVHEQAHADLINSTYYGYVLRRLRELIEIPEARSQDPEETVLRLSENVLLVAEGSATALEFIAAQPKRSTQEMEAMRASLPNDYQDALNVFDPLVTLQSPFPPQITLMLRSFLVCAVAEASVDWSLLTMGRVEQDFWQLARRLATYKAPDLIVPELVRAAVSCQIGNYAKLFELCRPLISDVMKFSRAFISGAKLILLSYRGFQSPEAAAIDDDERIRTISEIDARLALERPELSRTTFVTGEVLGPKARIQPKEPEYALKEVIVRPDDLFDSLRTMSEEPGFDLFVVQYLHFPNEPNYKVFAMPVLETDTTRSLGEQYVSSENVPAELLRSIDHGIRVVWLSLAVPLTDGSYYDAEFTESLESPVCLNLGEFSWTIADQMSKGWSESRRLRYYRLPEALGYDFAALSRGRRSIVGLVPNRFLPDFELGKAEELDIAEDGEMSAVAGVIIRTIQS